MSKKNNKATKRRLHAHCIEKEKQQQEEKQKKAAKTALAVVSKGIDKKEKKTKTFRLRKGVRVKGVIVKDSESKKKARKLLVAAGLHVSGMDVDEHNNNQKKKPEIKKKLIKTPGGGLSLKPEKKKKLLAVVPTKTGAAAKAVGSKAVTAGDMDIE